MGAGLPRLEAAVAGTNFQDRPRATGFDRIPALQDRAPNAPALKVKDERRCPISAPPCCWPR